MKIVYSLEEPPQSFTKSIFLAGPTTRSPETKSWRPDALKFLVDKGYDGVVFVPENRDKTYTDFGDTSPYSTWEHRVLDMSDLILFWVPRNLETLPGFTTNVEFGLYAGSGKALFGPPSGVKNRYLNFVADKFNVPKFESLEDMIDKALDILGPGDLRTGGEREIPLFLWNTRTFQSWLQSQKKVGNRLDGAKVYWTFKVGPNKDKVFYWAIHSNVYIASENRNKTNEGVISRFDISSVVLYKRHQNLLDSEVVLVREFRCPARTDDGFIWELPGGSSPTSADPLETITDETYEEVGLVIEKSRFKSEASRQMAGTMSSHHGILYSAELTEAELERLKSQKGIPHGSDYPDNPTGERAYTEVLTLREVIKNNLTDWSNLGMILSVVR